MYALALTRSPDFHAAATSQPEQAPRQPRSTIRRYERQEHTGGDAYRASLLAERLTAPTTTDIGPWDGYGAGWPWDITRSAAVWARLSAPTTALCENHYTGAVVVMRGQVAQYGEPAYHPATQLCDHFVVVAGHHDTVDAARAAWRDQMGTPCPI